MGTVLNVKYFPIGTEQNVKFYEKDRPHRKILIKKCLTSDILYCIILNVANNGEVAQLARASGSYPAGQEFESPLRHQK